VIGEHQRPPALGFEAPEQGQVRPTAPALGAAAFLAGRPGGLVVGAADGALHRLKSLWEKGVRPLDFRGSDPFFPEA
jgi:hypothetical protein